MFLLGLKMLINDRAKFFGLIVGITFATLLICQQLSIFVGALSQTVSVVRDVGYGDIWVSRKGVETIDFNDPLRETDIYRVRGIAGVESAVPLYVGTALTRTKAGNMRQITVVGLDDVTLAGAPGRMLFGHIADLRQQDAIIVDTVARKELFSNSVSVGDVLEVNRQRANVVGLCRSSPQFSGMAVLYTRRSLAAKLTNEPNYAASWLLVNVRKGADGEAVARAITAALPDLQAKTRPTLSADVIRWFRENSGITEVLGLAIVLGLVVGTVIVGQTFYMFAVENIKNFAALRAIGLSDSKLVLMILLQGLYVATIGTGLGLGLTAIFFVVFANDASPLRGMAIPASVALTTSAIVILMTLLAALASARKVLSSEPAIVFKA